MDLESGGTEHTFQHAERAGIGRGDGRAAHELGCQGYSVGHVFLVAV
jgi:hypothetical protein